LTEEEINENLPEEETEEMNEEVDEEDKMWGYCKVHGRVLGTIVKSGKAAGRIARCPICSRILKRTPYTEEEEEEREEAEEEFEEEEFSEVRIEYTPPEDEFVEKALAYLERELPKYGIKGAILSTIIDTLKANPDIVKNPNTLHVHIRSIYPRVNEYLLSLVIRALFNRYGHLLTQPSLPMYYQDIKTPKSVVSYGNMGSSAPQIPMMPYTPAPPAPRRKYKIAIDGQVIEVEDYQEYIALKEWAERQRKEKEEHDLRMKKLETEIKAMLMRKKDEEKEKEDKDETEIVKMFEERIKSLEGQLMRVLEEKERLENYIQELEKRRKEEELEAMRKELEEISKVVKNPLELIRAYEEQLRAIGYARSGKSLLDVLDGVRQDIGRSLDKLVEKFPSPSTPMRQPAQETAFVPKYSDEERKQKMEQLKKNIKVSKEIAKLEDELISAAQELYSEEGKQMK